MDIEQTKRMNFMIKELTKSGMVTSFEDAVSTASGLFDRGMPEGKTAVSIEAVEPAVERIEKEIPMETTYEKVQTEMKAHLSNEIKNNNVDIAKSMQKIWDELQSVKQNYQNEIQTLKLQLKDVRSEPSVQKKEKNLNSFQKEPHPRQGDYAPDNVVLENYFYCGQK